MVSTEGLIIALQRAWNGGDSTAWAENFSQGAEFIDVLGRAQRGRLVIAREHQKLFDTIYRESRLEIRQLASRHIGEGIVLVHTTSKLRVPAGPRAGDTDAIQTMIVRDGQILAFHGTIRTRLTEFAEGDHELARLSPLGWQEMDS